MIRWLAAYVGAGLAMAVLDAVWLTQVGPRLYRPALDAILMPEGFRLAPALLFYLIYLLGIVIFAIRPAMVAGRGFVATGLGALLGLVCYATYDLTNQATLLVWPLRITLVDLTWGVALTAVSATAGFYASRLAPSKS